MNQLSIKEKIIAKSLELFNQSGVESVTTRHIAKELGISQGNLHYHYPNKNELLKTLFANFVAALKAAEKFDGQQFEYTTMYQSMHENFKIMHAYRLFFQQNEVVWRRIPAIKEDLIAILAQKEQEIIQIINIYKAEGKFRSDISPAQIQFLAEQFILLISTWLTAQNYHTPPRPVEYYAKSLFRLWLPYLQQDEMKNWEAFLGED